MKLGDGGLGIFAFFAFLTDSPAN